MARDRRHDARPRGDGGGRVLSFISGLLIGLTVAVVVYFSMLGRPPAGSGEATAAKPVVQPKTAAAKPAEEEEPPSEEPASTAQPQPAPAASAKPAFDFYKILPDTEVKVPDEELSRPTAPTPTTPPATSTSAYVLQVGSYQKYEEADQKKAQLALQGITSRIERTVTNGQEVWFRVQVGPLKTPQEAQAMKGRLQEGGSNVVVLKVDGAR